MGGWTDEGPLEVVTQEARDTAVDRKTRIDDANRTRNVLMVAQRSTLKCTCHAKINILVNFEGMRRFAGSCHKAAFYCCSSQREKG